MFEESKIGKTDIQPPLTTMTGEVYQPARIYYQVSQKNAVLGRFKRLRCIDHGMAKDSWIWHYKEEAKNIKFWCSYGDIPKQHRPEVLGYFSFEGDKKLRLDVSSFDRVIEAIAFFDRKINRRLAKVTNIKIVNKLFSETITEEEISNHHAIFFDESQAVNVEKEDKEQLEEMAAQWETEEEKREAEASYCLEQMKKVLPEIEEYETIFYEEGIESEALSLRLRNIEAKEHWKGNKNFSLFDVVNKFVQEQGY